VFGYGPRGHSIVGAIADRRIAGGTNQTAKDALKLLLDGITLQQAATLPDSIKTWDSNPNGFHVAGHPKIESDLRAFWAANPKNTAISHHDFHYTDVPVAGNEQYSSGDIGRSNFDIVHMIPFCIRVLKNEVPETNDRKITKRVAVILLAHYVGDIHQPLHVGAEYFDASGNPFEPSQAQKGFADQGGNKLTLFTLFHGHETIAGALHGYWDGQTVENAFGNVSDSKTAQKLAAKEPADWKLTGAAATWAEQLANEIMPAAREAHERLVFKQIKSQAGLVDIISGRAEEKKKPGQTFYAIWAAAVVKDEIHKAGWRLAALLEEALQ
jgi:hypothetical protein